MYFFFRSVFLLNRSGMDLSFMCFLKDGSHSFLGEVVQMFKS